MTKNQQLLAKMGGGSLALLLSLSLGQQASAATLVENLSQPTNLGFQVKNNQWVGSSFQTGNASYGYTLNSVTLRIGQSTLGSLFVKLYSNVVGNPGTEITSFNVPSIGGTNNYDFTLTNSQLLTANTTYWLVAGILSGSGEYVWAKTNSTAETGLPGWSIGDLAFFSTDGGNIWNSFVSPEPFQFSVNGTVNTPPPPPTNIPEPGSVVALLGLGGLGLASRLKKLSTRA